MHSNTDVLIVGAGPVGLTLALLLATRGRSVAIYERWPATFPLPRAAAMSHETVRTFQSAGVLERLRPHLDLEFSKPACLYAADGELLANMNMPGTGESGYPPMINFNQPDVDRALAEMCEAHPRIEFHKGWNARALTQSEEHAVVTFDPVRGDAPREGAPIDARARFVVGCDGANSAVRSLLELEIVDTGFSSSWLVIDTYPIPGAHEFNLLGHVLDPARPATLAPAGKHRQRFEFMLVDGDDPERIADEASVWPLLARWDVTPEKVQLARRAIYTFRGRWADTWRKGRVLLAGDAAHQMPPFMGQGFNSGVRDAVALAWRLDLVLGAHSHPDLLDSYTSERLYHVKQIVEASVAVGQMICTTDPEVAAQRDAGLRMMRDGPEEMTLPQPDWRLGPGCSMPDDAAAGFLTRQARVARDGKTGLLDDLTGAGHFALIADGVDPLAQLSSDARAIWRQLDGIAVTIGDDAYRDVDGSYADWFSKLDAKYVLARPDFQIFGVTSGAEQLNGMILYLSQQLHLRASPS